MCVCVCVCVCVLFGLWVQRNGFRNHGLRADGIVLWAHGIRLCYDPSLSSPTSEVRSSFGLVSLLYAALGFHGCARRSHARVHSK